MPITLEQILYQDPAYITKFENWRQTLTSAINTLEGYVGSASGSGAIPEALKEIFDRRGIIGQGSYDFNEGTLSGPNYNLTIQAGAYHNNGILYKKTTSTVISLAGFPTATLYVNLTGTGTPAVSQTADGTTTRQFSWNATSHVVSNKALYSGVYILFDGDEWQAQLYSNAKAKAFTSVDDRLEEIEQGLDVWGGLYAQNVPHSGLNFKYKAGLVRNDSVFYDTPAGQVALTDNQTNYVEVNPADGAVSANTSGFTSGRVGLYVVTTSGGAITVVVDKRTAALAGTGGGGGGHTQGTDQGTTAEFFETDSDAAGNPTTRTGLKMIKGDGASGYAAIALNRATMELEKTLDDGATWTPLSSLEDLDLGGQEQSKLIMLDDPPKVLEDLARGTSADYEDADLSSYVSAPDGVHAFVLRVRFWDSAPASNINVLFKRKGAVGSPLLANTFWGSDTDPGVLVLAPESTVSNVIQFFVNASGADTANVQVFLLGYFKIVKGVGSQKVVKAFAGNAVAASTTTLFNLTGFLKRGLAYSIKIQETGGLVTGAYDVGVYAKDTCGGAAAPAVTDADKLFIATNIDPAANGRIYENFLGGWRLEDEDGDDELHLKIRNQDGSNQATFTVTITAERFE